MLLAILIKLLFESRAGVIHYLLIISRPDVGGPYFVNHHIVVSLLGLCFGAVVQADGPEKQYIHMMHWTVSHLLLGSGINAPLNYVERLFSFVCIMCEGVWTAMTTLVLPI